jgi:beta-lactamase superfamily II metal-dependent hydrolase
LVVVLFLTVGESFGLEPKPDAVFVRVVDVGAGECCIIKLPGNHNIIYDAGNRDTAMADIEELIPHGDTIDLLVLSHTDADHLGAVDQICEAYKVKSVIHSSKERTTTTWEVAEVAINNEPDCDEWDLAVKPIVPGTELNLGSPGVTVTLILGENEPPDEWGLSSESERNNAGSIVMRVEYKGKSILFCGDSVGRHIDDPEDTCIAAEKAMVDNAPQVPIASHVIVAPHHGADNGSSSAFIEAVDPRYVVFSAGHKFQHPRKTTAERYLAHAPSLKHILRTDFGDDEKSKEWSFGRETDESDPIGDDDVDIQILKTGVLQVRYRKPRPEPEQ